MLLRRRIRRWPLHIWIYLFTVRCTFRMSTRRLYVILFVLLFNVTVISYLLLRDVLSGLQVAEEFLFHSARRRAYIITTFHSLFNKYPPLAASIGYPPPNRSRLYKGGYIHCFYYHIIICQFAALFPLVTSQAWLRSDVPEPHPGVNCWREPYVPGSGCSGQVSSGSFRFPP